MSPFSITKQINITAVYLSGASCAEASNQSLLNKLAKESNTIIQVDAWNHMFANASALIYNTSKVGGAVIGSSLTAAIMGTQREQRAKMWKQAIEYLHRETLISSLVAQH